MSWRDISPHLCHHPRTTDQQSRQVAINTDRLFKCCERRYVDRKRGQLGVLRMSAAVEKATDTPQTLSWFDHITGHQVAKPEQFGDVALLEPTFLSLTIYQSLLMMH